MISSSSQRGNCCPSQPGLFVLAGLVSVCVALWEFIVVHGYGLAEWDAQPAYYGAHLMLDFLLTLPLAAIALMGVWFLADPRRSGWGEVLGAAVCISYVLMILLLPLGAARVFAHPAFDQRMAIALHEVEPGRHYAHSFGRQAGSGLLTAVEPVESRALLVQLAWSAVQNSLRLQWVILPLLALGLSCCPPWRQEVWKWMRVGGETASGPVTLA